MKNNDHASLFAEYATSLFAEIDTSLFAEINTYLLSGNTFLMLADSKGQSSNFVNSHLVEIEQFATYLAIKIAG